MSDQVKKQEHHIEVEQKVIHLMLRSRETIDELLTEGFVPDFFDEHHQHLVRAIYEEFLNSGQKRLLTRDHYKAKITEQHQEKDLMFRLKIYDKCLIKGFAKEDDLSLLKKELLEGYAGRSTNKHLQSFQEDVKSKGWLFATKNLTDRLQEILVPTEARNIVFSSVKDLKDAYIEKIESARANPEQIIECDIPEIDEPMNVGFRPQHLTLIVADVGGMKTNLMLNIAINISQKKHHVLFVPIEMPWNDLMGRIVCNRSGIDPRKLSKPHLMSDQDLKALKESVTWDNEYLHIMDSNDQISMSVLRREIEKRIHIFSPKVVVIDYADIMQLEGRFESRTIAIGHMLHSLRAMGKKYGFHILSAAQMNRAAIKAMREGNDEAVDSTAIHGSHNFGAVADSIFALMKVPGELDKLKIHNIKARHGPSGQTSELRVDRNRFLISSTHWTMTLTSGTDLETDINRPSSEIAEAVDKMPKVEFSGWDDNLDVHESDKTEDDLVSPEMGF